MTTHTIEPAGVPPERAMQVLPPLRRDPPVLGWAVGHGVSTVGDQIRTSRWCSPPPRWRPRPW